MREITYAYPWMLLGIPLLYLIFFLAKKSDSLPSFSLLTTLSHIPRSPRQVLRPYILHALLALIISSLAIGSARPQKITFSDPTKHRNILLVVDVSPSMEAQDIRHNLSTISRMEALKTVMTEFISSRVDDRLGLVVFSGRAFLQSPLTTDHTFIADLVEDLQPGIAGDGTAIGDGLGVALKRIRELPADTRSIILMTDGANNAGTIDPKTCGTIAESLGIRIHTIGIGGEPRNEHGFFDLLTPQAAFDEALLKSLAQQTHGVYFNAGSINKLREIYTELDALLSSEFDDTRSKITVEYYPYAALVSLIGILLFLLLSSTLLKRTGGGAI